MQNTIKNQNENINKNTTTCGSFFAVCKVFISCMLIFSLLLSFAACSIETTKQSKSVVYSFGEVAVTAYEMTESDFESMWGEIVDIANLFEATVSLSEQQSELSRANSETEVKISSELETQILAGIEYYEKTYGSFNILLAPIVAAWGFLPGEDNYLAGEIPETSILESLRNLTDITQISIEDGVLTKPAEFTIDLGGISKGYMADKMLDVMKDYNCDGILVVGGIVATSGDKLGEGYQVAITNPFGGSYFDVVDLSNGVLVTSGNYERYFEVDGEIYCHIINPETLSPTTSEVVAVSVISSSAMQADVFATALMILEEDKRAQLITENDLSALLIYEDGSFVRFGDFPE